jgi:Flp pilus assembly protein TadG
MGRPDLGDKRGSVVLELALVLPFFLLSILGVFAVGFLWWTENTIESAVQQAARCASINAIACGNGTQATVAKVQNAAIGWTNGILSAGDTNMVTVNLNVTCPASGGFFSLAIPQAGNAVKIAYPMTFLLFDATVTAEACYPVLSSGL